MYIRRYQPKDIEEIVKLFYDTVHAINGDYTKKQLNAWANGKVNAIEWNESFISHFTVVAEQDGIIVGFGDITNDGYLDRLYVHKDYQRQGIATKICDKLEDYVKANITTFASITAKPFFENRGYVTIRQNEVARGSEVLINFLMEKSYK